MLKFLTIAALLASPFSYAGDCPWMPLSRVNQAFPDRAPWSVMIASQGRCKFLSNRSQPISTFSLTQMVQESPAAAEDYVKTVGGGMASSYQVKPSTGIGKAGVAVRQENVPESRMLTLIGHQNDIVVMTQLSFHGGVSAAQQTTAVALTKETFVADTGGGLKLPSM